MTPFNILKQKYKPKDRKELLELGRNKNVKLWEIDTSLITDMSYLFYASSRTLNEDFEGIEYWDVSNVIDMTGMFSFCYEFDQPLNNWNTNNVRYMGSMFEHCANFNQPLDNWNVSNVENMDYMFYKCSNFDQPLNMWLIENKVDFRDTFYGCKISNENIPQRINVKNRRIIK